MPQSPIRNITKSLAVLEDLALGTGTVEQKRGTGHQIDVPICIGSEDELTSIDTNKFTYAKLVSEQDTKEYRYISGVWTLIGTGALKLELASSYSIDIDANWQLISVSVSNLLGEPSAGKVVQVKNTGGSLVTIYSNSSLTTVLPQNGVSNLTDSKGTFNCYVAPGIYDVVVETVTKRVTSDEYSTKVVDLRSIAFVFDDAYASVKTVLKPLFDTYNAKFGFAVPVGSLGNPNRLTVEGVREFAELGYEAINHASSGDLMDAAKGLGGVLGEIATCWSVLSNIGVKATGFQTPSSSLNAAYKDAVSQFSDYAFTVSNQQTLLPRNTSPYGLYRFSIEAATQQQCVDVLSTLTNNNGGVVFYAHDIANGDANYLKVQAILDEAAALGIPVLLPRACIERSVTTLGNRVKEFVDKGVIENRVADYVTSGSGESYTVGASTQDITITIPSAGSYLLQKTVNLTESDDIAEVVNYSALIRDLTGNIVTNCAVAMKLYSATNGGGTELLVTPENAINLNNADVRYYAEAVKGAAKSVLVYIRLVCSAAGSVLVRQPVLRYGTSIAPKKFVPNTVNISSSAVPTQTITAGAGYQTVTLTDAATNGLFAIASNTATFQKNAVVQVSFSPVASGAGVGTGFTGGSCAMTVAGTVMGIAPIAGGVDWLAGNSALTFKVARGTSITFKVIAYGADFALSSSNSRLVITEL